MLPLIVESPIWYGVVAIIVLARFVSRTLLFGTIKKLQIDDWIMAFAFCVYTAFIVSINIVAQANSNLLPPGFDIRSLTAHQISDREYGSKMILVVEQCQCVIIWSAKACLLIMYYRLTIALRENIVVKILAVYVAFGFVIMEIFYLGVWCRPFHNYWAVPTPNVQCSAATNHLITNAVFNLSSDLVMLVVALQMLIRSYLPLRRKLVLSGIFGLGIFVILAAVLNKYYSFSQPFGGLWTFWYVRESSTALLVANLPFTWTLLRRIFNLRAFDHTTTNPASRNLNSQRTIKYRRFIPMGRRTSSTSDRSAGSGASNSPTQDTASSLQVLTDWRENNYYGRADKEALEADPWDLGNKLESPIQRTFVAPGRSKSVGENSV